MQKLHILLSCHSFSYTNLKSPRVEQEQAQDPPRSRVVSSVTCSLMRRRETYGTRVSLSLSVCVCLTVSHCVGTGRVDRSAQR